MAVHRFAKALAGVALFNAILFVCIREDLVAADKAAEARKYLEDLRHARTAKLKITALQVLGKLAASRMARGRARFRTSIRRSRTRTPAFAPPRHSASGSAMSRSTRPFPRR